MAEHNLSTATNKAERLFLILRVSIALLIAAHGWARWLAGGINPFGVWLDAQGIPLGLPLAYAITLVEITGTPLLALGRFVTPICLLYCVIYLAGIVMVHAPEGWFVVGLGRNGMEYSVLLILCLLGLAYWYLDNPHRSEQ